MRVGLRASAGLSGAPIKWCRLLDSSLLMKVPKCSANQLVARIHLCLWKRTLRPRSLKCEDAGREKVLVKHRTS